jgi:predicted HicB family RNase H-like nuclease
VKNSKKIAQVLKKIGWRKKLYIRLDEDVHQRLRVKVAEVGTTIQAYIADLIEKSL